MAGLQDIHFLDKALWDGTYWRRSQDITPLFIERFIGPRQAGILTRHKFWELTCVLAGTGTLVCGPTLELAPGVLCLVPPGLTHCENADGNLDTIWIGLKGRHLNRSAVKQPCRVQSQLLTKRAEELWLMAFRQSGPIGPEIDATIAGIIARFFWLLSEGSAQGEATAPMDQLILLFRQQFSRKLSIADAARRLGYSFSHFSRVFKQRTGYPPIKYLMSLRLQHAKRLLEYTNLPILQVANQAGYEDQFYFSRIFRKTVGLTPSNYRRRGRREQQAK